MKSILNFSALKSWIFSFVFFLSSVTFLYSQQASDFGFIEGANFKKNVVYKKVDGKDLVMDIFYPDAKKLKDKNSWVLFVHGGGWAGGTKDNILKKSLLGTLQNLVSQGIVCVAIEYRLAKSPVTAYESAVDCKDAGKFLLKNADTFKLDDKEYGIWGGSAGGHLCLVTALAPDSDFIGDSQLATIHPEYKCVTSFFPLTSCLNTDLMPGSIFADGTLYTRLLGGSVQEKPEMARLLSPTEFLSKQSPPILLVHGDKDTTLPIINSLYMMEVAKKKNADVKLLTVKNGGHSFSGNNISPSFEGIADSCASFILSHIGKKK